MPHDVAPAWLAASWHGPLTASGRAGGCDGRSERLGTQRGDGRAPRELCEGLTPRPWAEQG